MGLAAISNFYYRKPPVRACYLDRESFIEAFGSTSPISCADRYMKTLLDKSPVPLDSYEFVLAVLHCSNVLKTVDFFGFINISDEDWPGNPKLMLWTVKDGIYIPEETFEDNSIILEAEEKLRRRVKSLHEYSTSTPDLELEKPLLFH